MTLGESRVRSVCIDLSQRKDNVSVYLYDTCSSQQQQSLSLMSDVAHVATLDTFSSMAEIERH